MTTKNQSNNTENKLFPPHIENPRINLTRTGLDEGTGICYSDGILYLISATGSGSLRICSADEDKTEILGELTGLGNTRQIEVGEVDGGRKIAAITARECGLYLIDVTNPAKPYICCHYNTVEFGTGIAFSGQHVAIGCRSFGVEIIDISNPENPKHLSVIRAGEVQSVYVDNGILYTGSWVEKQINIIDITDVTAPRQLATIPLEGRGDGVMVKDGILYAAFGQHLRPYPGISPDEYGYGRGNGFCIWDVSQPDNPKKLSSTLFEHRYYYCTYDFWDVKVSGHYAVVSHTLNGVWIYDITDLTAPVLVDHIAVVTHAKPTDVLSLNENTLKIHPMFLPFDYNKIMYSPITGVAVADGRLYVLPRFENLHIAYADYFIKEDEHTEKTGEVIGDYYLRYRGDDCEGVKIAPVAGQTHAIAYFDDKLWVASGMDGIRIYDKDLNCVGHYEVDGFAMDICEHNGYMYVAAAKTGMLVLKPEGNTLSEVSRFYFDGAICAQTIPTDSGRFVIAHIGQQHISILDVTEPSSPKELIRETDVPGLVYHRQITRNSSGGKYYGYYLNENYTHWYDLSGDEPVKMGGQQGKFNFMHGMTGLSEEYQALAVLNGGYVVFDIRESNECRDSEPIKVPGIELSGKPIVRGNTLFVTDRLWGDVAVCDISDLNAPKLLAKFNFSGHPDMVCPIDDDYAAVPLGHQGIALIKYSK